MNLSSLPQSTLLLDVFNRSIRDYHLTDSVDVTPQNPYSPPGIECFLYLKNSIDTVQWHLEDIIRNPNIDPVEALVIKRRIDKSNQDRTDLVEMIDAWFLDFFCNVEALPDATLNTETPAWAIDRLSILALKIHHMRLETLRLDASAEHRETCAKKLAVLEDQQADLSEAIDLLLKDIAEGRKYMKTYKQMKMYNDPNLNPELYNNFKTS